MGRGVSSGGGQSSLSYLFGSGSEAPKLAAYENAPASSEPPAKSVTASQPIDVVKQIPAGIQSSASNKYVRPDGKANFITDRPSTKIHSAPGGGSSLGYLFGGDGGK